ncbi:hypothetical protein Ocin01_15996 [Orchesella cincta]|uniref:F-box domain-containing protein n=1 Tax=Orchesella cincta TaxID=48709 RepID=A0A1D2MCG9_ORCCI|nr:hypothetical protein Ocin01_15996 [Orchesella cincta]
MEVRMKLMELKLPDENGKANQLFKSPKTSPMLFPENWEQIFKDLNPTDFLSVINTCSEWNQLLHSKKADKLLPLVLPHILEYLPLSSILRSRLVNKSIFKLVIDSTLCQFSTNPDLIFSHDPNFQQSSLTSKITSLRARFNLQRMDHLRIFLRRAEPLSRISGNPFLTGNLTIQLGRDGIDGGDQGETLLLMLTRFGTFISSLSISIYHGTHLVTFSTLCSLLSKLPNLKDLHLNSMIPNEEVPIFDMQRLPPLPLLESLCVMSFAAMDRTLDATLIMSFLNRYGRQLKLFSCGGRLTISKNFGAGNMFVFTPNLSHVKIRPLNGISMMKLALVKWTNLEMLCISGVTDKFERCCYFMDVIRVVNNFRETLKAIELLVTLNFKGSRVVEKISPEEMKEAPNLKKVTTLIENLKENWLWDFLKGSCANLEELHFQILPSDQLPEKDKMEARKGFGLLRKLRRIVFWFENRPKIILRR